MAIFNSFLYVYRGYHSVRRMALGPRGPSTLIMALQGGLIKKGAAEIAERDQDWVDMMPGSEELSTIPDLIKILLDVSKWHRWINRYCQVCLKEPLYLRERER